MDASDMPVTAKLRPDTATQTRLRGGWLLAARIGWALITVVGLGLFVQTIPLRLGHLTVICVMPDCVQLQTTAEGAAALKSLGISLPTYGLMIAGVDLTFALMFAGAGAIIFWRRSDDRMAILLSISLIIFGLTTPPDVRTVAAQIPGFELLAIGLQSAAIASLPLMMFIFPNGQFAPGWARWPALLLSAALFVGGFIGEQYSAPQLILELIAVGFGLATQVYRYRVVSSPVERQQTKWVVIGFAGSFTGLALAQVPPALLPGVISSVNSPVQSVADFFYRVPFGYVFIFLPLYLLPITMALSVLRYRLWDVDPIINRSLVYGALTVLLGAIFAGGFFGIRALLGSILGPGQDWVAAVIPAVAITVVFNPARRWLRHLVDERLYGIKIDYTPGKPAPQSVAAPRTTLGQYSGLELIGRGGMAEVYKATHPTLQRPVAIKVLPHSLAQDAEFRKRFEREARTVAALKHPNIVQMFDFGEADGTAFMVIEYIGGPDVGDAIRGGAMPLERALAITHDIGGALDYAHQQGLVHRDIKPSNVMLDPITSTGKDARTERAVLMDFGIARILSGNTRLTASGMIGTLDYMSPEQIRDSKDVDGRADVYSLGVMLFQMLTGRLPFAASNPGALLIAHLNQPAPNPREFRANIPEAVAEATLRAMEKDPARRFQTAGEFAAALA